MLELPESTVLARQVTETLVGRTITSVFNATHPHKFAWYSGDPVEYSERLTGKTILSARGVGAFLDICCDDQMHIAISDGTNIRYYGSNAPIPEKYQLLLTLDNGGFLLFTVAMYGCILAYKDASDSPYLQGALSKPSPLEDLFDAVYFDSLFVNAKKMLSVKAFLATEQRIPGLGNGVLQDILWRARIHPKRKLATITATELEQLYFVIRSTLLEMARKGGRNTERDLFGQTGGYPVLLSKNTQDCPVCGRSIVKEAYMGGAIYYCPVCQLIDQV